VGAEMRITVENAGKVCAVLALGFIAGVFGFVILVMLERSGN